VLDLCANGHTIESYWNKRFLLTAVVNTFSEERADSELNLVGRPVTSNFHTVDMLVMFIAVHL